MDKHNLIKTPEMFFRETFDDVIQHFGEHAVHFVGRKMYVENDGLVTSIEFVGSTDTAFNMIALTATAKNGPIEQNVTPLKMVFRESKIKNGSEKIVNFKIIDNTVGIGSMAWLSALDEDDLMRLNNHVMNFVELISTLN